MLLQKYKWEIPPCIELVTRKMQFLKFTSLSHQFFQHLKWFDKPVISWRIKWFMCVITGTTILFYLMPPFQIKMNGLSHSSLWFTALSIFCLYADPHKYPFWFLLVFVGAIDNFWKSNYFDTRSCPLTECMRKRTFFIDQNNLNLPFITMIMTRLSHFIKK